MVSGLIFIAILVLIIVVILWLEPSDVRPDNAVKDGYVSDMNRETP